MEWAHNLVKIELSSLDTRCEVSKEKGTSSTLAVSTEGGAVPSAGADEEGRSAVELEEVEVVQLRVNT